MNPIKQKRFLSALFVAILFVSCSEVQALGPANTTQSSTTHITNMTAVLEGGCQYGWEQFAFDAQSGMTYCMLKKQGEPGNSTQPLESLTYTITSIKGLLGTSASCGQLGLGWVEFAWDQQSLIHFCMQLGNGRQDAYLMTIGSATGSNGCDNLGDRWSMPVYIPNSNIAFCVEAGPP